MKKVLLLALVLVLIELTTGCHITCITVAESPAVPPAGAVSGSGGSCWVSALERSIQCVKSDNFQSDKFQASQNCRGA